MHVCRCIEESGASRVVLENVRSFTTTGKGVMEKLFARLRALQFRIECGVLDAKDFGLPQTRRRFFIVAMREELPASPRAHTPTPHAVLRSVLEPC